MAFFLGLRHQPSRLQGHQPVAIVSLLGTRTIAGGQANRASYFLTWEPNRFEWIPAPACKSDHVLGCENPSISTEQLLTTATNTTPRSPCERSQNQAHSWKSRILRSFQQADLVRQALMVFVWLAARRESPLYCSSLDAKDRGALRNVGGTAL